MNTEYILKYRKIHSNEYTFIHHVFNLLETGDCDYIYSNVSLSTYYYQLWGNIPSRFSRNSEAFAWEFLKD